MFFFLYYSDCSAAVKNDYDTIMLLTGNPYDLFHVY